MGFATNFGREAIHNMYVKCPTHIVSQTLMTTNTATPWKHAIV